MVKSTHDARKLGLVDCHMAYGRAKDKVGNKWITRTVGAKTCAISAGLSYQLCQSMQY